MKIFYSFFLCVFLLLTGCTGFNKTMVNVASKLNLSDSADKPRVNLLVPKRKFLKGNMIPPHVELAASALVLNLRHRTVSKKLIIFHHVDLKNLRDPKFDYKGFRWTMLDITRYSQSLKSSHKALVHLEGILHFTDSLDRMTTSGFDMDYELRPGKPIIIKAARIAHIEPAYPLVKAYFVPFAKIRAKKGKLNSFHDYLYFAVKNAVHMYATKAEKADKAKYDKMSLMKKLQAKDLDESTSIDGKWAVLVFCMDRLGPKAVFDVKVTSMRSSGGKSLASPFFFNDSGWHLGMVTGLGKLHDSRSPFFVHALYQPEPGVYTPPLQIGVFASLLNYGKPPHHHAINNGGGIASGKVILHPKNHRDAKIIQARLNTLGFYNARIDGRFGRASKASLNRFCSSVLHRNQCDWNVSVQKALFKNSGL